ncbi:vomeronasal 1 receptor cavPorV1R676 [Cavia porcellus]|uniref:vomeronasal 1 receptor cavPorV1R676 n=1 Tax=Cavia porcellus TaxID=10141 RepID=UPI0001CF73F3|nr:vomeronasal 1 receptor cavPorV1R676 [Cavia porcellus]
MLLNSMVIRIFFVVQTGIGILGNILLLYCYVFIPYPERRLKHMDLILKNLILANCLVLLSKGVPHTILTLGLQFSMGDVGCKLVFYLHRVARGVTLGTTCILSGFQSITISPNCCQWIRFKVKSLKCTRFSITFCWILQLMVNSIFPLYMRGAKENNSYTHDRDLGYCSSMSSERVTSLLHSVMLSSIDVLSLGFMVWSSVFMMLILYRHKQNVLHIHSKNLSSKSSAETRATQTILILLITFFSVYTLSSFFTSYISHLDKPCQWLVDTSALLAASFSCFNPFILICRDPHFTILFFAHCPKMNNFGKLIMYS